jgi:hypothetical protein
MSKNCFSQSCPKNEKKIMIIYISLSVESLKAVQEYFETFTVLTYGGKHIWGLQFVVVGGTFSRAAECAI